MENIVLVKVPYYYYDITEVPQNIFSVILFCYLGYINVDEYEKYLQIFLTKIKEPNPNKVLLDFDPHEKYPENTDIPVNSYLFTLGDISSHGEITSKNYFEFIRETILESTINLNSFYLLCDFFNISPKFYSRNTLNETSNKYFKNSNKQVHLFTANNKIYPILIQEIDGVIRLKSNFLV